MALRIIHFISLSLIYLIVNTRQSCAQNNPSWDPKQTPYPKLHTVNQTWTYASAEKGHNVTVPDPYNWLEADLHTDKDVLQFIADETKLTEDYMTKCKDKDVITDSLYAAFNYDDYDNFFLVDGIKSPYYTYSLKRAKENRPTWYICTPEELESARKENLVTPPGKKFLIEDLLSENGTSNVQDWRNSPDGKYFAYLVSDSNSDVATWYVRQIDKPLVDAKTRPPGGEGHLPNDVIPFCQGSFRWRNDSSGFFYVQSTDSKDGANTQLGSTIRYHRMGISHDQDITLVHPDPVAKDGTNNAWSILLSTEDKWLIIKGVHDVLGKAKVFATFLPGQTLSDKMKWISVAPSNNFTMAPINVVNDWLYFGTNRNALNGKVAKAKLDWSKARQVDDVNTLKDSLDFVDVIPTQNSVLFYTTVAMSDNLAIVVFIKKGKYVVQILELETGKLLHTALPNESLQVTSIVTALKGKSVTLGYSGTTSPRSVYEVRMNGKSFQDSLLTVQIINGIKLTDFVTEDLFATSLDGTTKVPYSIVYRKGTEMNGQCTAWLHAYGNYGKIEKFYFDPTYFSWLNGYQCTFFVWGSPRGGGDLGEEWHIAGQRHNKTKTIEDTIAIAQDLVKRKIAAPGKVIGEGISAGGMIMAASSNQAPAATFGVVLPKRAVLDFFLRKRSRGGASQIGEFGDVDDPKDFDTIIKWSPLQNINKSIQYPAMLLTPGDSDDRVVASHSFKFLAQIQADHPSNKNPLLMHLVKFAGHTNAGLSTKTAVIEGTHQLCVVSQTLGGKRII